MKEDNFRKDYNLFVVAAPKEFDTLKKMETIEEQSKYEDMSSSPPPENLRICLVGSVVDDKESVDAAQTFGIPVITSENGIEFIEENDWRTYFILNEFSGPIFDAISKTKHRILGPPALKYTAQIKENLPNTGNRPIYNYSMRGVITCFTGIRKKDELIQLVYLIHSMGGSIRKDMNSKVTHLICNTSGGEKYQYGKTFRLAVVRSAWVYDAWKNRDIADFRAINDEFTKDHTLKAFEGQKICFFGFAPEEHQHMVEVLQSNGGIPTDLEDPECSHVVMANTGGYFPENLHSSPPRKSLSPLPLPTPLAIENKVNIDTDQNRQKCIKDDDNNGLNSSDEPFDCQDNITESTPKTSKPSLYSHIYKTDGIVLKSNEINAFNNPNNISPILTTPHGEYLPSVINNGVSPIDEEDDLDEMASFFDNNDLKRRRDSFDSMSIMSTDSLILPTVNSAKKPKLIRTGSITRSLKRRMSFVSVKTPIANMLKQRRNSTDPDASINSITMFESTFNESIKKPVKEKMKGFRDLITRSGGNKQRDNINSTPKTVSSTDATTSKTSNNFKSLYKLRSNSSKLITPEKCSIAATTANDGVIVGVGNIPTNIDSTDFKTPVAPKSFQASSASSAIKYRHSVCGVGNNTTTTNDTKINYAITNTISTNLNNIEPPVRKSCAAELVSTCITTTTTTTTITETSKVVVACNNECDISLYQNDGVNITTVVDEHFTQAKPEPKNIKTHIVKSDWFWYTIQNGYADEMDYLFGDYLDSIANTPCTDRRDSLPISFNKRKRKRISQRMQAEGTPIGAGKRRSSVSDAGLLSVSGSFLDCTSSPEKHDSVKLLIPETEAVVEQSPKNKSMRYNHFIDFFSTESNYVGILDTIVTLFKNPLEEKAESGDALLNKSEVKAIFGNFLPIHEVHQQMLERLREIQTNWHEESLIGEIILNHRDDLIKAYPPYVNFFEQMKESLIQCDTQNPRFHAFLKINQVKPECGRQTLQDLMIRPVQRLPSISLLLNDILKHTNKNNPDHKKLEEALKAIKEVMAHINEDKRKTEGQLAMFDIFNDIEGCPAQLVSSHRSFISKCEVTELSENLSGRGDSLMLYLFSDTIEVCKKRSRGFNSAKSPSTTKSFKHIRLMPLSSIRFVIDISDCPRGFSLNCRQDNKEKLYSFTISDEEVDKVIYLKGLCKQMAENACRTDTDKSLLLMTSQELDVDISDVNLSTLSKAFKLAARTRMKVGRAFSFNKTPSKLKRAVSTMMTSPFGSTNSLTPASQLAQMRLASCTNLNEVGEDGSRRDCQSSQSEILVAPLSVQPTRKAKSATMSMAALRRL